jgi:hypothetical protein
LAKQIEIQTKQTMTMWPPAVCFHSSGVALRDKWLWVFVFIKHVCSFVHDKWPQVVVSEKMCVGAWHMASAVFGRENLHPAICAQRKHVFGRDK